MKRFEALLAELAKLVMKKEVHLLGSAILAIRGVRDVQDLDVLATPDTMHRLWPVATEAERYAIAFKTPHGAIQISDRLSEFGLCRSITAEVVREKAEHWQGWRVISLDTLKQAKRIRGQDKDHEDLRLLKEMGL